MSARQSGPWAEDALAGQVVLCTGAGGAIGSTVAAALARAGATVVAADLTEEAALRPFAGSPPGRHHAVGTDLRRSGAPAELVEEAVRRAGRLDAVVDMAAVIRRKPLDEVTEEDWDLQLETNLRAPFFLFQAAARVMREQGDGGRLVAFSSQGWWTGGFSGSLVYNAGKGGIVTMTRNLARTLGPHGITANAVAPAFVDTPMFRKGTPQADLEALLAQTPLGRLAEPDDLTGPVLFLLTDAARYISGTVLNVSGGFLTY